MDFGVYFAIFFCKFSISKNIFIHNKNTFIFKNCLAYFTVILRFLKLVLMCFFADFEFPLILSHFFSCLKFASLAITTC